MNINGLILGASAFLCIGICLPLVIKAEYYLGKKCWWLFALAGVLLCAASLLIHGTVLSAVLGVAGFSAFWSILELFKQEERVSRGWFPRNPRKK